MKRKHEEKILKNYEGKIILYLGDKKKNRGVNLYSKEDCIRDDGWPCSSAAENGAKWSCRKRLIVKTMGRLKTVKLMILHQM